MIVIEILTVWLVTGIATLPIAVWLLRSGCLDEREEYHRRQGGPRGGDE